LTTPSTIPTDVNLKQNNNQINSSKIFIKKTKDIQTSKHQIKIQEKLGVVHQLKSKGLLK
jgi:hypothetical protein